MKHIQLLAAFTSLALVSSAGATTIAYEFNIAGDTEGWTANAQAVGFGQATGIDGDGVVTANDLSGPGNDPQLSRGTVSLPSGETWSSMEVRFRHLSGNPGAGGTTSTPYSPDGTILFFNGTLDNRTPPGPGSGLITQTYSGAGAYAGDTFDMTMAADGAGDWQLMTLDVSGAGFFNSSDITSLRLDVVGNAETKNFEVDYVRFTSVPEPGSAMLLGLAATGMLLRRRR